MSDGQYVRLPHTKDSTFVQKPFDLHVVEDQAMLFKPGLYGWNMKKTLPQKVGKKTELAFDPSEFSEEETDTEE